MSTAARLARLLKKAGSQPALGDLALLDKPDPSACSRCFGCGPLFASLKLLVHQNIQERRRQPRLPAERYGEDDWTPGEWERAAVEAAEAAAYRCPECGRRPVARVSFTALAMRMAADRDQKHRGGG